MSEIESPCVRSCELNKDKICVACLRSLDEIIEWGQASNEQKLKIITRIKCQSNDA